MLHFLDVLHLWQLQRSLQRVDDHVEKRHLVNLVSLRLRLRGFAGTGHQHVLDLTVDLTWHLLDHLHLSLRNLHDVLITPSREWNLLCFISSVCCGILSLHFCWHVNVHVL